MADTAVVTTLRSTMSTGTRQVLEFELGPSTYCVDIEYVTEIVDVGDVTDVPNAPRHVQGVMDIRGRTTAIVDPTVVFGVDGADTEHRIVVFDPNVVESGAAAGWLVDEVDQAVSIDEGDVDPSPADDDPAIHGVLKCEDGFVIWVDRVAVHAT